MAVRAQCRRRRRRPLGSSARLLDGPRSRALRRGADRGLHRAPALPRGYGPAHPCPHALAGPRARNRGSGSRTCDSGLRPTFGPGLTLRTSGHPRVFKAPKRSSAPAHPQTRALADQRTHALMGIHGVQAGQPAPPARLSPPSVRALVRPPRPRADALAHPSWRCLSGPLSKRPGRASTPTVSLTRPALRFPPAPLPPARGGPGNRRGWSPRCARRTGSPASRRPPP